MSKLALVGQAAVLQQIASVPAYPHTPVFMSCLLSCAIWLDSQSLADFDQIMSSSVLGVSCGVVRSSGLQGKVVAWLCLCES